MLLIQTICICSIVCKCERNRIHNMYVCVYLYMWFVLDTVKLISYLQYIYIFYLLAIRRLFVNIAKNIYVYAKVYNIKLNILRFSTSSNTIRKMYKKFYLENWWLCREFVFHILYTPVTVKLPWKFHDWFSL